MRPGGHLVIADSQMDCPMVQAMPDGSHGYMPHHSRMTSEYLTAALPLGFEVRHCEELRAAPARCSPEGSRCASAGCADYPRPFTDGSHTRDLYAHRR